MRPHPHDFHDAVARRAVMGICTLLDRIDESMLDTDSSGIVSREISDKGFVSWGVCKRVFLTTSMSFLVFPSSPAALSFLASFAACLVNTTFHMLTTPGNLRRCSRKDARRLLIYRFRHSWDAIKVERLFNSRPFVFSDEHGAFPFAVGNRGGCTVFVDARDDVVKIFSGSCCGY